MNCTPVRRGGTEGLRLGATKGRRQAAPQWHTIVTFCSSSANSQPYAAHKPPWHMESYAVPIAPVPAPAASVLASASLPGTFNIPESEPTAPMPMRANSKKALGTAKKKKVASLSSLPPSQRPQHRKGKKAKGKKKVTGATGGSGKGGESTDNGWTCAEDTNTSASTSASLAEEAGEEDEDEAKEILLPGMKPHPRRPLPECLLPRKMGVDEAASLGPALLSPLFLATVAVSQPHRQNPTIVWAGIAAKLNIPLYPFMHRKIPYFTGFMIKLNFILKFTEQIPNNRKLTDELNI
ncbi:hypothetical protein C8R44DRAFT_951437 [Mycena epipterygia]|nr:hypothetical protein C8R44DRAFT_951437 [Mycena epipterygia]